jgi:hypothetical protein
VSERHADGGSGAGQQQHGARRSDSLMAAKQAAPGATSAGATQPDDYYAEEGDPRVTPIPELTG